MTMRTTAENAQATLDVLPDASTLLDAVQRLVDAHVSAMAQRKLVKVHEPAGAVRPVPPSAPVGLKEALLAGEPA